MAAIREAFDGSGGRYGVRKVWHQLRRSGHDIARCTVERLMRTMRIQGVVRGRKVITTNPDTAQPCPDDRVNRVFVADRPSGPEAVILAMLKNVPGTARLLIDA
ncbi:IS3 family transposase, partial [Gluconobacter kondonii]|uniref:IS3 family transposase n=1 Tax=Gluconobacter kondonii TaxID=941463 RepID=UPI0034E2E4FA